MGQRHDVFPRRDSDFYNWQDIVVHEIETNATAWKIDISSSTTNTSGVSNGAGSVKKVSFPELKSLQANYKTKYLVAINPSTRTSGAIMAKREATQIYQDAIRAFLKEHVTYNSEISDEERLNMGLPVHKIGHTPAPQETTHPEADASTPEPATIEFKVHVEGGTGTKLPPGQKGVEVRFKVSDEVVKDWDELVYSEFSSRMTFRMTFNSRDRGRVLYFAFRWENTRGKKGPWGNIHSIIIS